MDNIYIDIGSTNIKYMVNNGDVLSIKFPDRIELDNDLLFEVDVYKILDILKAILLGREGNVYISTQMHGYVLCDRNHNNISNYISWRDKRFLMLNENYPFCLQPNSGVHLKPNLPALSIYTNKKLYNLKYKDACYFDSLGSFIYYKLTNKHCIHLTDACPSGFYLLNGMLNTKLTNLYFKELVFPKVVNEREYGLYNNLKIYPPIGDQQAACLGVELNDSEYLLNTGTASQICCLSSKFIDGDFEPRPYFDGKYLCTMTGLLGGAEWVKGNVTKDDFDNNYSWAVNLLPKKQKMISTGGLVKNNKQMFEDICLKITKDYNYIDNGGAIEGLKRLGEKMKRQNGTMISEVPFSNLPIILKNVGFDFFILDYEHGGFDYTDISKIITISKLVGLKCIIRLADNTRKDIIKFMDMGADGLMLRMTNNKGDIMKVVEYAKYAPLGKRGISTMRAHTLYNPPELLSYMEEANKRTEIYAQIETIDGVNNLNEILDCEGVAGCLVGPNDLSCEYGCLKDKNAPQILTALEKVAEYSKKINKNFGIITTNKNYLDKCKQLGYNMYCVGSELNMIKNGALEVIDKIQRD